MNGKKIILSLTLVFLFFNISVSQTNTLDYKEINERISQGLPLNVRWFGASGNSKNDTEAFKNAIKYLHSNSCSSLYIPSGTYLVDSSVIKLNKSCKIYGDGQASVIMPVNSKRAKGDINSAGIEILSTGCIIEDIQIRDYAIGIKWNKLQQININRCHIYQNNIGIFCTEAYINNISNNYITFNKIGVVALGQSYQLLMTSNVIDNNIANDQGGVGVFLSGSNGCEIRNNTIEGNRNLKQGIGCGIYIAGVCTKLNIVGNWFEVNYEKDKLNTIYSVDIYCANGAKDANSDQFQNKLINHLIPKELISHAKKTAYGSLNIRDNIHVYTPYAIVLSYFSYGRVSISGQTFTGSNSFENKPIFIRNNPNQYYNTVFNVSDNREQNTAGNPQQVNKKMLSGFNNSLLFIESNFKATGRLTISYEGKQIYETK